MSKGLAVEHALAAILSHVGDDGLSTEQALALADMTETQALMTAAAGLRDRGFYNGISYSRKVFIPLTYLCRDVCHYCTFAKTPKKIEQAYLRVAWTMRKSRCSGRSRPQWASCLNLPQAGFAKRACRITALQIKTPHCG